MKKELIQEDEKSRKRNHIKSMGGIPVGLHVPLLGRTQSGETLAVPQWLISAPVSCQAKVLAVQRPLATNALQVQYPSSAFAW